MVASSVSQATPSHDDSYPITIVDQEKSTANDPEIASRTQGEEAIMVDWDGPADPTRPVNWPKRRKYQNVLTIALISFLTPLDSSIVAPAQPLVMETFHTTNKTLGTFVVSIYLIGFAFGPLIYAPLSELYGRLRIYQLGTAIFILWNVACASAPNMGCLLAFRLLAGIFGSSHMALGSGSIADMFVKEERGLAIAVFGIGPVLGPVVGPIAGGYLSQAVGWRWIFWLLCIVTGVALVLALMLQSETYEPAILQKKVVRLRHETGNLNLYSRLAPKISARKHMLRAIVRPMKLLFMSPIVSLFSIYMGVVFGYLYLLFTTIPGLFKDKYNFSQGASGLTYIGVGIGTFTGMVTFGILSDKILIRLTARNNNTSQPEFRLPPLIPGSTLIPIGLFWYGWSADKGLHWMMPIVGMSWIGAGMTATLLPIQAYLVDAFGEYAASAMAAATVVRSLMGAFLPLAGPAMFERLGFGWGNSLLGFIALGMLPLPVVFYCFGGSIRERRVNL